MGLLESILGQPAVVRPERAAGPQVVEAEERADYTVCGRSGWSQDQSGAWVEDEWTEADGRVAVDLSVPKLEAADAD